MPSLVSELVPSWSRICCASGQTARRIESTSGAWRFRALNLDTLTLERHYRHGAPSCKDSNAPLTAAAVALEKNTANEVNSDRPR